jgi:hypothetical protein
MIPVRADQYNMEEGPSSDDNKDKEGKDNNDVNGDNNDDKA